MKKSFLLTAISLALALTAILAVSCTRTGDIVPQSDDTGSSDTAVMPDVDITLENKTKLLTNGDTFVAARHADGEYVISGNCKEIYDDIGSLYSANAISGGYGTLCGIMADGTVKVIGKNADMYKDSEQWQNIVDIAWGEKFMLGLTTDGNVLSCGNMNVSFDHVKQIAADGRHGAVLFSNGTVETFGSFSTIDGTDLWTDIEQIACGTYFVVGVKKDGTVLSYNNEDVTSWYGVHGIKARGKSVAAFAEDGYIISNIDDKGIEKVEKACDFIVGDGFINILCSNGRVKSFGNNDNMQCATSLWDLGIKKDKKGYITGFAPDTDTDFAKALIKEELGIDATFTDKDGNEINNDTVCTGMYVRNKNGKTCGRILIYGDTNGDGSITKKDLDKVTKYLSGTGSLKGIYLAAADTLHRFGGAEKINATHSERIKDYLNGEKSISQHNYDPYAEEEAEYYSINSDVTGWIHIKNTCVDHPILYGNNYYYLSHNLYRHSSALGLPSNVVDRYAQHNSILGHNGRKQHIDFYGLHTFQNQGEALKIYKNRVIGVTVHGEYSLWELFSLYETGPHEPVSTQKSNQAVLDDMSTAEKQAWIDERIKRSERDLDVEVDTDDTFMTLYTCGDVYYSDSMSQSRLYLHFRKVG